MTTQPSGKFWIKYRGPIESLMSAELSEIVDPHISYSAVYYRQGAWRKTRHEYRKSTIISKTKEGHAFYTGFIPKIEKICADNGVPLVMYNTEGEPLKVELSLPEGMDFREFQSDLIKAALSKRRGVLVAPTGTGKTFLGLSLIYSIKNIEGGVLWLCHTKDLMNQTAKEAAKFFGTENVGMIGDGICDSSKFLTVATRQSFRKIADELGTAYDVVIVDEVHHLSTFSGEYAEILGQVWAPVRIGLTATTHTDPQALLAMEAFIGPVVGKYTIDKGRKDGYMANPIIKVLKTSKNYNVSTIRKYQDVYECGIVRNLERNRLIVNAVDEQNKKGKSCLIVVNKIAHGELLTNLLHHNGNDAVFVCGSTDSESRTLTKQYLNEKNLKCVICTTVWKEGVNIPELDVVINAAGGKSEIVTLQSIGRGLRRTASKENLLIIDFFDPSHYYLISHFGERLCLYMEMGWM